MLLFDCVPGVVGDALACSETARRIVLSNFSELPDSVRVAAASCLVDSTALIAPKNQNSKLKQNNTYGPRAGWRSPPDPASPVRLGCWHCDSRSRPLLREGQTSSFRFFRHDTTMARCLINWSLDGLDHKSLRSNGGRRRAREPPGTKSGRRRPSCCELVDKLAERQAELDRGRLFIPGKRSNLSGD